MRGLSRSGDPLVVPHLTRLTNSARGADLRQAAEDAITAIDRDTELAKLDASLVELLESIEARGADLEKAHEELLERVEVLEGSGP